MAFLGGGDAEVSQTILILDANDYLRTQQSVAKGWLAADSAQAKYAAGARGAGMMADSAAATLRRASTAALALSKHYETVGYAARHASDAFMVTQRTAALAIYEINKPARLRLEGIEEVRRQMQRLSNFQARPAMNFQARQTAPLMSAPPHDYRSQVVRLYQERHGVELPRLRRATSIENAAPARPFDFLAPSRARQRIDSGARLQLAADALARRDTLRAERHARVAAKAQRIVIPQPKLVLPSQSPQRIVVPQPKIVMPQYQAPQFSKFTGQAIPWRPKTAPAFDPLAPHNMTPARLLNPGSAPQIPRPRRGLTITDFVRLHGADAYAAAQARVSAGWDTAKSHLGAFLSDSERVGRLSNIMAGGLGIAAGAAVFLGKEMLQSAGSVESNIAALTALTGSAEKAKEIFGTLDAASTSSIFERKDILVAGRLLTAYGMDVKRFLPLSDDLAAAFKDQGVSIADTARVMGRLKSGDFGEAFERLRDFGISRKELEGQGLVFDNGGSYQGSVEQAMTAVENIIKNRFSGLSKKLGTETFEGAASQWSDALARLEATGGEVLLPSATQAIKDLTELTSQVNTFAKAHPGILQNAVAMGKYTLAVGLAAAAGLKALQGYLKLREILDATTKSKRFLAAATDIDAKSELAKTSIAGAEGRAIGGVGTKADETANKLGILARARVFMGAPAMVGGGYLPTVSALGYGGGMVSKGGMALGVGLGVGAAVGAKNDMQALGYTDSQAQLYGAVAGALTAGVTVFFPPARALVAAAELLRLGVNHFWNEPIEKKTSEGTLAGDDYNKTVATKDRRQEAALYTELAAKAFKEGDMATGESFAREAISQKKAAKVEDLQHEKDAQDKRMTDALAAFNQKDMLEHPERHYNVRQLPEGSLITPPSNAAYERDNGGPPTLGQRVRAITGRSSEPGLLPVARNYGNEGIDPNDYRERLRAAEAASVQGGQGQGRVTENRNGATVVTLPAREADHMVRTLKRHNDLKTDLRGQ